MSDTKLLGTGYPYEVHIENKHTKSVDLFFLDEESGMQMKKDLTNPDTRYVDIDGTLYFWGDVKKCGQVKVDPWLDKLIFHSIQKKENRMLVLREIANRARQGRKFLNEEDVFSFLSINQ